MELIEMFETSPYQYYFWVHTAFNHAGLEFSEFQQLKDNPLYYISKDDRLFSINKAKLIKIRNNGGYKTVFFAGKLHYIHRLKMYQWSEVPANHADLQVNHKDGVKSNNDLDNLEWCTPSQNIQHAHDTCLVKKRTGSAHHRYGKKTSAETKALQSAAKMGSKHPKFKGYSITPWGRFESAHQAALASDGIDPRTILNRCLMPLWHKRGYGFEFPDGTKLPAEPVKSLLELFTE